MTRALYRSLLWLHPREFRRQFAGEMLWIFDQAADSENTASLLGDGAVSLFRQWTLRSGLWKVAVALLGGLLEIVAGGAGRLLFGQSHLDSGLSARHFNGDPRVNAQLLLAVCSVTGILLLVVLLVVWVKNMNTRRIHDLAISRR